jgi:hypothetical protein
MTDVAISEFSEGKKRRRVCFWGEMPNNEGRDAFTQRGYRLESFTVPLRTHSELAVTDSVVISQRAANLKGIHGVLRRYAQRLLELDCRIYVRVASAPNLQGRARTTVVNIIRQLGLPGAGLTPAERKTLPPEQQEREGLPLAPYVFVCDVAWTWEVIAQVIADNPAGESPNLDLSPDAVSAKGKKLTLSREGAMLVRRAFQDCSEVHLRQMQDGLSGVRVFRAYAKLSGGMEGKWPASYFVKIGNRKKIGAEYYNYQAHALQYLPFNLAPRLTLERCGLGACHGIIVGDFVEQSEALRDSASAGRAVHAIGMLFSRTLGAWRHAARKDDRRSLPEALSYLLPAEAAIPAERKVLIRSLGATPDLSQIRQLLDQCDAKPILVGTIHGDLNASNILIRFSDAILIDFEQLREGRPLLYDAASVEAGLLVDGFAQDRRRVPAWLKTIEPLYDSHEMFEWRVPCHPKDGSAWFYDCVREIRLHAKQLELKKGQYATALALAFVKKSCNPHLFHDRRDSLRAAAYILAERILNLVAAEYAKTRP